MSTETTSFKCYDPECSAVVLEQYRYCLPCQQKHFPNHPTTKRELKTKSFQFKSQLQPASDPKPAVAEDLWLLSFQEIKDREKRASDWLVQNAGLKTSDSDKWGRAMDRYRILVKILNLKTPMS